MPGIDTEYYKVQLAKECALAVDAPAADVACPAFP